MLDAQRVEQAAESVYEELGPGHSESVYHNALETELSHRGVPFSSEGSVPIYYRGKAVGYRRPDLFVGEDSFDITVVELKAHDNAGKEQIQSYFNLSSSDENITLKSAILVQFGSDEVSTYIITNDDAKFDNKYGEGWTECVRCGEEIRDGRHMDCPEWR
jgi:GxxExxY protein